MAWLQTLFVLMSPSAVIVFTLVIARVGGIVVTAPIFGGNEIPAQVRVLLTFALSVLVAPVQLSRHATLPTTPVDWLLAIISETLVGLILGLGLLVIFSGMQIAGQLISQLGGMSIGEVFNPQFDTNMPLFSQLLHMFALALFAISGGHRQAMQALLDTFAALPCGQLLVSDSLVDTCTTLITQSFHMGIRVAAPAVLALLLATLVLGIISRTLPQLNVLSFGFGVSALVTFGIVWVSLGAVAIVFQHYIDLGLDLSNDWLSTPNSLTPATPVSTRPF